MRYGFIDKLSNKNPNYITVENHNEFGQTTKGVLNRKYDDFELETEDSVVVIEKKKRGDYNRNSYDPHFGNKMIKSLSPRNRYDASLNYPGTSPSPKKENTKMKNDMISNFAQRELTLSAQ